jgi:uncharacterized protein YggE
MHMISWLSAAMLMFGGVADAKAPIAPPEPVPYVGAPATVSINVSQSEKAAPDIATLSTGVQTTAKTAKEAMDLNNQKMLPLIEAIKALGIEPKDVQTSGVRLGAEYDYSKGRKLKGYQAANRVTVTVRDLSRIDKIIGTLVGNGANELDGPYFSLDDSDALADVARGKAYDLAMHRAEIYAKRAGFRGVKLLTVNEGADYSEAMAMDAAMGAAAAAAGAAAAVAEYNAPIEPGEITVTMSANFSFELIK